MTDQAPDRRYDGNPAEIYQRYFVPVIGGPVAEDLIEVAQLRPGESVLDVACGTGTVTRLAAQDVGVDGTAVGLDVNPGMLAVARSETPSDLSIDWHEANAESMPLGDQTFDVVLCQMGLQFVPDKAAALGEMRRVLSDGGRAYITLPGPKPAIFEIMAAALARHLGPQAAGFVDRVFSLHDAEEIAGLLSSAGFREVAVEAKPKDLSLPAPRDFLWQYVHSTPLTQAVSQVDDRSLDALESDICAQWQGFVSDGGLSDQVRMTTASAVR